jgi:transcriptional regulator of acetoin/glycerol metabolism
MNDDLAARIRELADRGLRVSVIAQRLGVGRTTVWRVLRQVH